MQNSVLKRFIKIGVLTFGCCVFIVDQTYAQSVEFGFENEPNKLKMFSAALGLNSFTEYSLITNSVGFRINRNLGFVTSFQELESFKSGNSGGDRSAEKASTRVNTRFAIDMFKPFFSGSKVYSRVGLYLWDLNINLDYSTAKLDISHSGLSQLIGIGTAFKWKAVHTNIDLEHYSASSTHESSDTRLLLNLGSRF